MPLSLIIAVAVHPHLLHPAREHAMQPALERASLLKFVKKTQTAVRNVMGAVDLHGKGRSLLAEKGPTPGSVAPNALDNVPLASIEGRWYDDGQEEREPLNDWGEGRIPGWGFASIRNNVDPPSGHLPYNLQGQGRGACWLGRGNDGGARESTRLQRGDVLLLAFSSGLQPGCPYSHTAVLDSCIMGCVAELEVEKIGVRGEEFEAGCKNGDENRALGIRVWHAGGNSPASMAAYYFTRGNAENKGTILIRQPSPQRMKNSQGEWVPLPDNPPYGTSMPGGNFDEEATVRVLRYVGTERNVGTFASRGLGP